MPIEAVKVGDMVWAENPETGEKALKRVAQTFVRETDEFVHIKVDGQNITTTPEHPFWVPQKGWTDAIELRAGDQLVLQNGKIVIIELVQHELLETPATVYNFEVEDLHAYYVTTSSVLVHNTCTLNNIYSSIKKAPGYSSSFKQAQNGLVKNPVTNRQLLAELNKIGSGWQKVYQNGWVNGNKVSYHYFQSKSGQIFDFWVKNGWS